MSATTQQVLSKSRMSTPSRKRNSYRTRSYSSNVDETLFGSPSRFTAQKETSRINPDDVSWEPPWVTSPRKSGAPLLWTPYNDGDMKKSSKPSSPRRPTTPRNKYRLKKQVPSYVDEALFGTPRKTHLSNAPWSTEQGDAYKHPQATWSPPLEAPVPDMTIQSKRIEVKADTEARDMRYTPVIKARQGSTINTPQSTGKSGHFRENNERNLPPKLDFCVENGANVVTSDKHDPDAIVQRALRLAGVSKDTSKPRYRSNSLEGLSSRVSTPGRYFWRRPASPASTASRPSTVMSGHLYVPTHSSPDLKADDLFSATGTKLPLSARGGAGRPDSARTINTDDSVPGLDLSKPPRLYTGVRTPGSARSVTSGQSTIMNRPSWRP